MRKPLLACERDDEEAAGDGDGVFDEGGWEILAEGLGECSAEGCSAEGSDDCADGSGDATGDERAVREAECATCEGTYDDASDELWWDRAAGGAGALVVDDLGDGE